MTATEVYESVSNGGATDFAEAVAILNRTGQWCLIGGLAVNCYVEPVYTMDADFVAVTENRDAIRAALQTASFIVQDFPHSFNAKKSGSKLSLQFSTDLRYQDFLARAQEREVLGIAVPVAALDDLVQGKIWAWGDPARRLSKRKKDELDLIRIAEAYPHLVATMPAEIVREVEQEREK
jgi:hypothetical protein